MGHLKVRGLGKAYKHYHNRWAKLGEWLSPWPIQWHRKHWVLRNVDFELSAGDSVGIIGRNGAGKSTLLKLITGTTHATEGDVSVGGRVAALLELGMGFHPEFTGRQNARIAGQLLGISGEEVDAKMGEIESFAEIGPFIDEPVRIYSSGMQVRLAFSVATAVRPDILIVDEALAVGDAYFQHKCFDLIRRFRREGTTLLFVSHDPGAVKQLCDRAILIDAGRVVRDGYPNEVLDYYNALLASAEKDIAALESSSKNSGDARAGFRSGNRKAELISVKLISAAGNVDALSIGAPLSISVEIQKNEAIGELALGLMIKDRLGIEIFGTNTYCLELGLDDIAVGQSCTLVFHVDSLNLGPGSYSITLALHRAASHLTESFDWWDHAALFRIVPEAGLPSFIGVCKLPLRVDRTGGF